MRAAVQTKQGPPDVLEGNVVITLDRAAVGPGAEEVPAR